MKKTFICGFLASTMLFITACGSTGSVSDKYELGADSGKTENESAETGDTDNENADSGAVNESAESGTIKPGEEVANPEAGTVLVDSEWVTVTLGDVINTENYVGYEIDVKNNTSDQYVKLGGRNFSVNGYMTNVSLEDSKVAPGEEKTAHMQIPLSYSYYNEGVQSVNDLVDIEGTIEIWTGLEQSGMYGQKDELYSISLAGVGNAQKPKDSADGEKVVDTDDLAIYICGKSESDYYVGYSMYVVNKSEDTYYSIDANSGSVDGAETYLAVFYGIIAPGKVGYAKLFISKSSYDYTLDDLKNVSGNLVISSNLDGSSTYEETGEVYPFTIK